ncbi:FtsK/SpoIIIE domain-containing protein [Streptococcus suis]|uniref:FtsK/SpoIIIE domain-containing protein n=2 Tax=Streptococcus suis TaxID=1307 RepID=UPI000414ACD3|nr:FtsK/SpoIIIE domain-containing protein [Streptococcus suis]
MARTFKKNVQNVYTFPFYRRFGFWWLIIFCCDLLSLTVWYFLKLTGSLNVILLLSIIVMILSSWKISRILKRISQAVSFMKYLLEIKSENAVTKSLLATMSVNRLQETPYISVPDVKVSIHNDDFIKVEIEKLSGMYDIDRLTEDINASFRDKLSCYAVTSGLITDDGLTYRFILEDVATNKTWQPATMEDITTEKYAITLQEGLTVRLDERAHIAVWGKTGSKKTTVLLGMILQFFSMGSDVRFIDGKDEFSSFQGFYPSEKIVSDPDDVFAQLEDVLAIIKQRQKIMADEVQKRGKMGLKASRVDLRPVVVVADEIGSIVALMDSKQAKRFVADLVAIIQRGRSVGVSVIASTQDPSTDTLPQKIRQQFSTKILLGSANGDIQRMAFGEVATAGDVEDFRGFYTCDGLTNQPMKFFVCDLYSHGFNELGAFKTAYDLGLKTKYGAI